MKTNRLIRLLVVAAFALLGQAVAAQARNDAGMKTKTEKFDRDPHWEARNNRPGDRNDQQVEVRQDFGYSETKPHGSGRGAVGGFIQAAGEAAFYGKIIEPKTLEDSLSASGTFTLADGGTHLLLGFFNADTTNEWRTPNTLAIRINGRGDHFYAYVEYCTSKWRAGGDNVPFSFMIRPASAAPAAGLPSGGKVHTWSLKYDPDANNGSGVITATLNDFRAVCQLDPGHKADRATFNRFGIMNVMKSVDGGTEFYLGAATINGQEQKFDRDPNWDARGNRAAYQSNDVRPRFDFGYSPTNFTGNKDRGEIGGRTFRGDCRYPERMASYADKIGPITLDKPIKASGKLVMRRGVTDSTTTFGFFNANQSMRSNPSQSDAIPESMIGINIEGPSREGFLFYPVLRPHGGDGMSPRGASTPHIYPDSVLREWSFEYDPRGAQGKGQITVSLDGKPVTLELGEGDKACGTSFDRFGIITTWIDGNGQTVYFDDITYTTQQ